MINHSAVKYEKKKLRTWGSPTDPKLVELYKEIKDMRVTVLYNGQCEYCILIGLEASD